MIVLDSSALFAILLDETHGPACEAVPEREDTLLLSAGTFAELLVVAAGKSIYEEMLGFVGALGPTIVPLTSDRARAAAEAYRIWGKGLNKAKLNSCDVFAYALAEEHECPLVFVGNDFALTDVTPALA